MGRPKGSKNLKQNQIREQLKDKYPTASKSIASKAPSNDPIEAKKQEIERDKENVLFKPKAKSLFDTYLVPNDDSFDWITQAFCKQFKLNPAGIGFRTNFSRWDFPKGIQDKTKRHIIKRQYFHQNICVDVFNDTDSKKEINRIKAHLEAVGFKYTYIIGGENEADMSKVFTSRLAKLDPKSKDYPVFKVPKDLAEAGFVGHNVMV